MPVEKPFLFLLHEEKQTLPLVSMSPPSSVLFISLLPSPCFNYLPWVQPYPHPKELMIKERVTWSLYLYFLYRGRKCYSFFPISPHFYPVMLNFFPNKPYYYFYYKKERITRE
jgi:hypothetical protein